MAEREQWFAEEWKRLCAISKSEIPLSEGKADRLNRIKSRAFQVNTHGGYNEAWVSWCIKNDMLMPYAEWLKRGKLTKQKPMRQAMEGPAERQFKNRWGTICNSGKIPWPKLEEMLKQHEDDYIKLKLFGFYDGGFIQYLRQQQRGDSYSRYQALKLNPKKKR